jgi:hypothetical protein
VAAILLTVALFAFWAALGYAALGLLRPGARPLANALLAPAAGLALTLLPVFLLSRAGLPVLRLAWPLAGALAMAAALLVWRCRPSLPPRRYAPFAATFVLALGLTGRPMLEYGFDWLSYCNGDMANYCCSTTRVLHHGLTDAPTPEELTSGRDYALVYWMTSVPGLVRPGSELVLAWVCALSGLAPPQAFMTVMLAFHLVLVSAAGALVCRGEGSDGPALLTCGLAAASALVTLGTLYQLIAQVAGVALLCGAAAALFPPFAGGVPRGEALRRGVLAGIFGSALLVLYPEIVPFLAVGLLVYVVAAWRAGTMRTAGLGWTVGGALAFALVVLNTYLACPVVFLLGQAKFADVRGSLLNQLFPYYLLPSGLAHLWGLAPIGNLPGDPWLSAGTVAGGVLLLLGAAAALRAARKGHPAGAVGVAMLVAAGVLLLRADGFGLFKLGMFAQPFMLAAVVSEWCALVRRPLARWSPLLLLAAAGLPAQSVYLRASYGQTPFLVELPDPSRSRLLARFAQAVAPVAPRQIILDTLQPTLGTLQALHLRGTTAAFPSTLFFHGLAEKFDEGLGFEVKSRVLPAAVAERTWALTRALNHILPKCSFDLHDPERPGARNQFRPCVMGRDGDDPDGRYLVCSAGPLSIFNRSQLGANQQGPFAVRPWAEVHNYLLFTPSMLGNLYPAMPDETGPCRPERDQVYPDRTMAGAGRHTLFEVLNPRPQVRLVLDLTTSLHSDRDNSLPPAAVVGRERVALPLRGRGSARVFSPPIWPQHINGRWYLDLDLGRPGARRPRPAGGLNRLASDDLTGDPRYLVGFLRNVSLVSEEEYARRRPPALLSSFPADLLHPDLEYCGLYEDGWAGEAVCCTLTAPGGAVNLIVRGMVPCVGGEAAFRTRLRVLLDGREAHAQELGTGEFDVRCPQQLAAGPHQIELLFSNWQHLPGEDGRPATAKLSAVGFESLAAPPTVLSSYLADVRRPEVEPSGLYEDGWAGETASCTLSAPGGAMNLIVRGMVPCVGGDAAFRTRLRVLLDGREAHAQELQPGAFVVCCPAPARTGPSRIELLFSRSQQLSSSDPRRVAARIETLGFVPSEP